MRGPTAIYTMPVCQCSYRDAIQQPHLELALALVHCTTSLFIYSFIHFYVSVIYLCYTDSYFDMI